MKISREIASRMNPLIGDQSGDTLNNVSGLVGLIQDLSIYEANMQLSIRATRGFFQACELIHAALEFEGENS